VTGASSAAIARELKTINPATEETLLLLLVIFAIEPKKPVTFVSCNIYQVP
jgi:hypothetical protein